MENRILRAEAGKQPCFDAERSERDAEGRLGRNVSAREIEETRIETAIDVRHIGACMSLLVQRFLAKGGPKCGAVDDEIVLCVKVMRRRLGLRSVSQPRLEPFLSARNIRDVTTDETLKADGALVPMGA